MNDKKQALKKSIEDFKDEMKELFDENQSTAATYEDLLKVCQNAYYVFVSILEALD